MSIRPAFVIVIVALGVATAAGAQTPTPRTSCRIVGTTVTCTNLHPVSEAAATAILLAAIAPFVPDPAAPVVPPFAGELHPIQGEVFSDRWPYEAAGVYSWLLPGRVPSRVGLAAPRGRLHGRRKRGR